MTVSSPYALHNPDRVKALELALQLHTALIAFDGCAVKGQNDAVVESAKKFIDFIEGPEN